MNCTKSLVFIVLGMLPFLGLQAQTDFKFGFRAGMTLATMMSPDFEKDANGNSLENYRSAAKISVGATISYPFSDRFGATGEVLFSQKGALYRYESDNSYLKLPSENLIFEGQQRVRAVNITNGFVEVPLMIYFRPIKDRLQLDFGPSISFLISSRELGILKYGVIDDNNPNTEDFLEINLDYKLLRDEAGAIVGEQTGTAKIQGTTVTYPRSLGGYYFYDEKQGSYYSAIDFGLNFGASLYFTEGLRVGGRAYLGLMDVTNDNYDLNQSSLDADRNFIFRKDVDRNFGVQLFIALQF